MPVAKGRKRTKGLFGKEKDRFCTMKDFSIFLFAFCCLYLGEMKEWPRHTVCRMKNVEVYYKSCDPLQDIGVSFNPCPLGDRDHVNLTIGVILRHHINSLFCNVNIFNNGHKLLNYEETFCDHLQRYSFCRKKKGEFVLFHHPVRIPISFIPQGNFRILTQLLNEDNLTIACADFNINIA
ncbi:lymphocyte antigen 86 [Hyperolius riggenbachi]|uniref:lymphocyte antigen 86 n=1 Tax=Hyperolius riggenbachi TaxID=752182 RepID=UPI0035A35C42